MAHRGAAVTQARGAWMGGFDKIMRNLNAELGTIEGATAEGLVLAAMMIRNATENEPPLTPVRTGNLRASWFIIAPSFGTHTPGKWVRTKTSMARNRIWKASSVATITGSKAKFKGTRSKKAYIATRSKAMKRSHMDTIKASGTAMRKSGELFVIMGYSANYAAYVHEMLGATFQREGAGPRWFQIAVERNRSRIFEIIKENASI